MRRLRRLIKIIFGGLWDFVFLTQVGAVISLCLAVVGALLYFLNAALALPDFLEQWLSSTATFSAELSSGQLAVILAAIFISLSLISWWRRSRNGITAFRKRKEFQTRTPEKR